jgi:hypothetical protein
MICLSDFKASPKVKYPVRIIVDSPFAGAAVETTMIGRNVTIIETETFRNCRATTITLEIYSAFRRIESRALLVRHCDQFQFLVMLKFFMNPVSNHANHYQPFHLNLIVN